jgi:hypothetical protein
MKNNKIDKFKKPAFDLLEKSQMLRDTIKRIKNQIEIEERKDEAVIGESVDWEDKEKAYKRIMELTGRLNNVERDWKKMYIEYDILREKINEAAGEEIWKKLVQRVSLFQEKVPSFGDGTFSLAYYLLSIIRFLRRGRNLQAWQTLVNRQDSSK